MMPITSLSRGITRYADRELLPQMQEGWQKVVVGMAASVLAKRGENLAQGLQQYPILTTINLVDGNGNIDAEVLQECLKERIPDTGLTIALPVIGTMTIHKSDVDRLYSCMLEV